jgi:membrane fusion protein, multidrug efflux system
MFYIKKNSIFLYLCLTLLSACGNKKKEEANTINDKEVSVRLVAVKKMTSAEAVSASGVVSSSTEARLAFKTGGIIDKMYVNEGDVVKKGQLLAKLNLTEINAQVAQANEGFAKIERDKKRVENLYKDSVATLEQLQNITTAYNVAKQNIEIARFNQNFSEIRATSNGRIVKKIMNEGELVGPGMPLFYMTADGAKDWVIKVGVSDKDWARLKEGDAAQVTIDAFKGETFSASVSNKAPSIDPQSGLYQMELKFQRLPSQLALGLFANVKMQPKMQRTYLTIPIDAIIEGNGNHAFVFIAEQGKAKKINVETVSIQNGNVLIASGLQEGQQVITDGSAYLMDGVTIKVVN